MALAFLVAAQGLAVAVIGSLGRLHTHDARQAATIVVLDDLRRGPTQERARGAEVASRHGHSHNAGAARRHPHRGDDASVTFAKGEPLEGGDAEAASAGTALAALVALVPAASSWVASAPGEQRAVAAAWVAHTRPPDPFERPPRPA